MREGAEAQKAWSSIEESPFYAVPPAGTRSGLVPVFAAPDGSLRLQTGPEDLQGKPAAPLFLALAPETGAAPRTDSSLNGLWHVTAISNSDDELEFELKLTQSGTAVYAVETGMDGDTLIGSFKDGKLSLTLATADSTLWVIKLTAALINGVLTGEWKQTGGGEFGTWTAKLVEPPAGADDISAVVPLYEYEQPDGTRVYSTDPALSENHKRAAKPLCRVWRNPLDVLALDPVIPAR
jgi:hypothetical protein